MPDRLEVACFNVMITAWFSGEDAMTKNINTYCY